MKHIEWYKPYQILKFGIWYKAFGSKKWIRIYFKARNEQWNISLKWYQEEYKI